VRGPAFVLRPLTTLFTPAATEGRAVSTGDTSKNNPVPLDPNLLAELEPNQPLQKVKREGESLCQHHHHHAEGQEGDRWQELEAASKQVSF